MSDPNLERVLDEWGRAWAAHDIDRLVSLFTDDAVYEDIALSAVSRGKAELRAFAEQTFAVIPDFRLDVVSRFACGGHGAIEWTMSGTQAFDIPGFPATGKSFSSLRAVTIVEFRDGKISRNSDYWDGAGAMRQTGALPAVS